MWPTDDQSSRRVRMYKIEILEAVSLGADCCSPVSKGAKQRISNKAMGCPRPSDRTAPAVPRLFFSIPRSFLRRRGLHMSTIITASAASRWSQRLLCDSPPTFF